MFAKKSLGQNFLMHAQTAQRIVTAAHLPIGAFVLEIGPGTGMLTNELLAAGMHVLAIEADHTLIEGLEGRFAAEIELGKLILINADIRTYDPVQIPAPYHVVANIPYYITGEIIRTFLTTENKPVSMTLLVQKEVAERIVRAKKESLLSLSVKAYGTPLYRFTVPRGAFYPAPNVDSAVLHIADIRKDAFASRTEEAVFFDALHAGFAHKRKQLGKNLESVWPKESVAHSLAAAKLLPSVRAEDLSLATWRTLARELGKGAA